MKCYAFDVDECLEISQGPVTLKMMEDLRAEGHIVGVCGNMNVFCSLPDWHQRISFLGQGVVPKDHFLFNLAQNIRADEFIMVGNIPGATNKLGVVTHSDDIGNAARAGWRFIKEDDFANGVR